MPIKLERQQIVTILTLLLTMAWLASFIARIFLHWEAAAAPTLDAAVLLMLGYWFSTNATKGDKE